MIASSGLSCVMAPHRGYITTLHTAMRTHLLRKHRAPMAYATTSDDERNTMWSGCDMLKAKAQLFRYDMAKKRPVIPT